MSEQVAQKSPLEMLQQGDIAFAIGVTLVLAVLFVPLPPFMLDMGLAVSLSLSALILMVALWVPKPLEFNSFPTLLLVVTMLRLSLNVASTRLILSEGHTGPGAAGGVIEGFSRFFVSGRLRDRDRGVRDPDRRELCGDLERLHPDCRGFGALLSRRDAGQADGNRCRSGCGADR